jgi:Zn-dependent protease with chaperone function
MTSSGWTLALVGVENFILLNAALSAFGFGVAAVLRAGKFVAPWHPRTRARLYAATLVIPVVVSAWLVCASLLPAAWLGSWRWQQEHEPAHTLHLLNAFTIPLDPLLGYMTLIFATLGALVAVYAAISAYFRIGRVIKHLEIGAAPAAAEQIRYVAEACRRHGINVGLVASDYPFSFVWGYWDSKLVLSTGLLNALSADELAGVLAHETAHHERRDNLAKLALTLCRYLSPAFPLTSRLYRWWGEEVEMVCDEIATGRTQAPVELAGALVRLKRLTRPVSLPKMRPAASSLFGDEKENFERRVNYVLSLADRDQTRVSGELSRSCVRVAMTTGAAFALTLAGSFAVSPLAIHKVVELILHI